MALEFYICSHFLLYNVFIKLFFCMTDGEEENNERGKKEFKEEKGGGSLFTFRHRNHKTKLPLNI